MTRKQEKVKLQINPDIQIVLNSAPRTWTKKLIIFLVLFVLTAWSLSALNFKGINGDGLAIVFNIFKFFIWPDSNASNPVISRYFLTFASYGVPYLMFETLMIAFIGTILGAIISIPLAFLSSRNITGKLISGMGTTLIAMIRTVPIFIWGIIFIRVQGGPLAGVLAIAVSSTGMISKLYIEIIEDIDTGILEALDSTGATTLQKIIFGIIPQIVVSFVSVAIYRYEINVRNATILGMVGAGGIGFTLLDALGSFNFGIVAVCLWGIIPVVVIIEYLSGKIRTKLV